MKAHSKGNEGSKAHLKAGRVENTLPLMVEGSKVQSKGNEGSKAHSKGGGKI